MKDLGNTVSLFTSHPQNKWPWCDVGSALWSTQRASVTAENIHIKSSSYIKAILQVLSRFIWVNIEAELISFLFDKEARYIFITGNWVSIPQTDFIM